MTVIIKIEKQESRVIINWFSTHGKVELQRENKKSSEPNPFTLYNPQEAFNW